MFICICVFFFSSDNFSSIERVTLIRHSEASDSTVTESQANGVSRVKIFKPFFQWSAISSCPFVLSPEKLAWFLCCYVDCFFSPFPFIPYFFKGEKKPFIRFLPSGSFPICLFLPFLAFNHVSCLLLLCSSWMMEQT